MIPGVVLGLWACSAPATGPADPAQPIADGPIADGPGTEPEPAMPEASVAPVTTAPGPSATASTAPRQPFKGFKCQLPEPKVSDDPCSVDGDCKPSVPCHAPDCVAAAKAQPGTPDTMCTRNMVCDSVDANRCGCYQGRCALIPPGM